LHGLIEVTNQSEKELHLQKLKTLDAKVKELCDEIKRSEGLRANPGGAGVAELLAAGWTPWNLKVAGYTAYDLVEAGLGERALRPFFPKWLLQQVLAAVAAEKRRLLLGGSLPMRCFAMSDLKDPRVSTADLHKVQYTAGDLLHAGYSLSQLKDAGYTALSLKAAGSTAAQLKGVGYAAEEMRRSAFTAHELNACGFSAGELKAIGFTPAELKCGGFSAKQLQEAFGLGFVALKLSLGFSMDELVLAHGDGEWVARILRDICVPLDYGGHRIWEGLPLYLKPWGFSAMEMAKHFGVDCHQLRNAGVSDEELMDCGFTKAQVHARQEHVYNMQRNRTECEWRYEGKDVTDFRLPGVRAIY